MEELQLRLRMARAIANLDASTPEKNIKINK
jgi:hypothetical protein